jgi:hypothetical protein
MRKRDLRKKLSGEFQDKAVSSLTPAARDYIGGCLKMTVEILMVLSSFRCREHPFTHEIQRELMNETF